MSWIKVNMVNEVASFVSAENIVQGPSTAKFTDFEIAVVVKIWGAIYNSWQHVLAKCMSGFFTSPPNPGWVFSPSFFLSMKFAEDVIFWIVTTAEEL